MDEQNLQKLIESEIGRKTISKIKIPEYNISNLKHDFWYWQKEALQYFFAFDDPEYEFEKPVNEPTHLMFNMATGTGKTLLMAVLILYYYKKDYKQLKPMFPIQMFDHIFSIEFGILLSLQN